MAEINYVENQVAITESQGIDTAAYLDEGLLLWTLPNQTPDANIDRKMDGSIFKKIYSYWFGIKEVITRSGLTYDDGNSNQLTQALDQRDGFRGLYAPDDPTPVWTTGTYGVGEIVEHNGVYWFCNAFSTTDIPGPETDWKEVSTFREKIEGWSVNAGWSDIADPKHANFQNYYRVGQYRRNGTNYDRFRVNVAAQNTGVSTEDFYKLGCIHFQQTVKQ